jgi:hypothetical protein
MIDTNFVKQSVQNPVLILRFKQDSDIGMAFCADLNEQNQFVGLSLYYIRKSSGKLNRTAPEITSKLFKPVLSKTTKKNCYSLQIRPLTHLITIIQKGDHFICQFPFKDKGKVGKITHIDVTTIQSPLKVDFNIHATFRKSKESDPEILTSLMNSPEDFTKELYNFFMSN